MDNSIKIVDNYKIYHVKKDTLELHGSYKYEIVISCEYKNIISCTYKNGNLHGKFILVNQLFCENIHKIECNFKDGKLHGEYYEYFNNIKGDNNLDYFKYNNIEYDNIHIDVPFTTKCSFKEGKLHNEYIKTRDSVIVTHKIYKDDKTIGQLIKDGNIRYNENNDDLSIIKTFNKVDNSLYRVIKTFENYVRYIHCKDGNISKIEDYKYIIKYTQSGNNKDIKFRFNKLQKYQHTSLALIRHGIYQHFYGDQLVLSYQYINDKCIEHIYSSIDNIPIGKFIWGNKNGKFISSISSKEVKYYKDDKEIQLVETEEFKFKHNLQTTNYIDIVILIG